MSEEPRVDNFHLEELSVEELERQVESGIIYKVGNHTEHFAIHPYWINRPKEGVLEELTKTLGKWNNKLQAYVVGFEDVRSNTTSAAINEDHKWLHFDVLVTFFLYKPEIGQRLQGTIKKIGNLAAICIVFNVFSATVFPTSADQLKTWSMEDVLDFEICSFKNCRKGPLIRAKDITSDTLKDKKSKKKSKKNNEFSDSIVDDDGNLVNRKKEYQNNNASQSTSDWEEEDNNSFLNHSIDAIDSTKKKKKKKDKHRKSDHFEDEEIPSDLVIDYEASPSKKKSKKRIKQELIEEEEYSNKSVISESDSPKKKKKHKRA